MKVLIVGGGIAGMTAAAFLHRQGNDVLIVDNAPEYRHIGFGLYLWHYGRQVLDELGIGHHLLGKEYMLPGMALQNVRYKTLSYLPASAYGRYRPVSIHRADLHEGLRETVADVPVRFNTTVNAVTQEAGGVLVKFSDGSTDRFDMVVGADGIHSSIRTLAMENPKLRPYGWRSWYFWADTWKRKNEEAQMILAPARGFGVFPLHDRHFAGLSVVCSPDAPDPIETRRERLHDYARPFDRDMHDFIDSLDMANVYHTDLMSVPMGAWAKGRVVLIGDARHALSPATGRGANLALEDASVLAALLGNVRPQDVPAALQRFGAERTRRVEPLRKHLRTTEWFLLVRSPLMHAVRNVLFATLPSSFFVRKPDPRFL